MTSAVMCLLYNKCARYARREVVYRFKSCFSPANIVSVYSKRVKETSHS